MKQTEITDRFDKVTERLTERLTILSKQLQFVNETLTVSHDYIFRNCRKDPKAQDVLNQIRIAQKVFSEVES